MAEQQGGAGVLGACGAGHWARGEAVFLCPPLLRKGHVGQPGQLARGAGRRISNQLR